MNTYAQRVYHDESLTIRVVESGPAEIHPQAVDVIKESMMFAMQDMSLPGHLCVTIVAGDSLACGEDDTMGFGMYMQGLQTILIAGGIGDIPITEDEWLNELRVSTIHEVVHYKQDIEGRLLGTEENEDEAEQVSREIVKRMLAEASE